MGYGASREGGVYGFDICIPQEKERIIPSTFLSPPGIDIQLGDDTWREAYDLDIETDNKTTSVDHNF